MIDAIHSNETRTGRSDLSPARVNRDALAAFRVITSRKLKPARSSFLEQDSDQELHLVRREAEQFAGTTDIGGPAGVAELGR